MPTHNRPLGYLLGFVAIVIFGMTLPITHIIVNDFSVIFITSARVTLAATLAGLLWLWKRFPLPKKSQLIDLVLIAFGIAFSFPFGMSWAMTLVPASHGGVVLALLPMMTSIYARILTHERPSRLFWCIAILGAFSTVGFSVISGVHEIYLGDAILLLTVLATSLSYALSARLTQRGMPGWQVISWAMLLSMPISAPVMLLSMPESGALLSINNWLWLAYLGVFSQYLAFFAWNKGLAVGGIAHVSQMQLLQPFITILGAWWLYQENIDILTIAFGVYIVGLIAIQRVTH